MANISVTSLTLTTPPPSPTQLKFTVNWAAISNATLNSYFTDSYPAGTPQYGKYYRIITGYSVRAELEKFNILDVSNAGNSSAKTYTGIASCWQVTPGELVVKYPLDVYVGVNYNIYKGVWNSGSVESVYREGWVVSGSIPYYPSSGTDTIGATQKTIYRLERPIVGQEHTNADGSIVYYDYCIVYQKTYTAIQSSEPVDYGTYQFEGSVSKDFYPHQTKFTFTNLAEKMQWLINEGINSKIENIEDFQKYARQYKSWKTQTTAAVPGGWTNSKNQIAADNVNALYTYIDKTSNYSPGDKVSYALFKGLQDGINS